MDIGPPIADVTQIAALVGAATALIAAAAGVVNLRIALVRERPALTAFARTWATGVHGAEQYIEVCVANIAPRPISVVSVGLILKCGAREWRVTDGNTAPSLPAKLEDGEAVTMTWLRDELGQEFYEGAAHIVESFAIDARGNEVKGTPPR
jgi:hypothetical protein